MVRKKKQPIVRLYSRSRPIVKALMEVCEEHNLLLEVSSADRPVSASFLVTTGDVNTAAVVSGNQLGGQVVVVPEGGLYLASSANASNGLTLVGSDHVTKRDKPKPEEGVLF